MFDDVRRHIIYRLANAPLFHFPFLHIVVDEILPRDVYETLQEALPDEDVGATEAQPFRRALHPAAVAQSSMDDARKAFWASMFATMMHDDIGAWIMAKSSARSNSSSPCRPYRSGSPSPLRCRRTGRRSSTTS